eukprot:TRINITY_DN3302_c0_g1_i1.p1 TRINITY_DN3302_c0_g1~~TRINITY_DN3302_c0_g1_i1.p1  ORF type:complete len:268 (-),score=60.62 TRINITY_DN3302_c0_g1_i1:214-1017(-)
MDFSNFEDDFFEKGEEEKGKQKEIEPPYHAKIDDEVWFKDFNKESLTSINSNPVSAMKYRYTVDHLFNTQKFAEAKDLALSIVEHFSDDSGLVRDMTEICYYCSVKLGDYVEALGYCSQLAKDRPKNPSYHFFMGECLYSLKRYDEAVVSCFYALNNLPNSTNFLYLLSQCYFKLENFELANKVLDRCTSLLEKTLQQKKSPWDKTCHKRLKEVEEIRSEIKKREPFPLCRLSLNEEVCRFEHQILEGFQLDNNDALDEPEDNPINL